METRALLFKSVSYRWFGTDRLVSISDLAELASTPPLPYFVAPITSNSLNSRAIDSYGTRKAKPVKFCRRGKPHLFLHHQWRYSRRRRWRRWSTSRFAGIRLPPPRGSSFFPRLRFPAQVITLSGTNLTGAASLKLNGVPLPFTHSTNSSLLDLRLVISIGNRLCEDIWPVFCGNALMATRLQRVNSQSFHCRSSPLNQQLTEPLSTVASGR